MAAVCDQDAVLEVLQRLARNAVDRARGGDEHVGIRERLLERRNAVAVHVRLERGNRIDLDDRHAPAGAARRASQALADPAVADDAELPSREAEIRQPVDRRKRRLAGAVAVVEQVLAKRVVGGDRRKGEPSGRVHRAQACDAGRRLLGHAGERGGDRRPVLDDPRGQLAAVVDDDLGLGVRDGQQVGVERVRARAVTSVHLDPARDERCADRVLGRARVRAGGDDLARRPRRAGSRGTPSSPRGGRRRRRAFRAARRLRAAPSRAGSGPASAARPTGSAARPAGRATGRRCSSGPRRPRARIYPSSSLLLRAIESLARALTTSRGVKPRAARSCGGGGCAPLGVAPLRGVDEARRGDLHALRSRTPRSGPACGRRG